MYFCPFAKEKILFGWSAKSGCTHVKYIYWFLRGKQFKSPDDVHTKQTYRTFLPAFKDYKVILFVRNPYKRVVSAFQYHYGFSKRRLRKNMVSVPKTFKNFCEVLDVHGLDGVNTHHFAPQFREAWVPTIVPTKIFDIEAIDYAWLEDLFGKSIPQEVREVRGSHTHRPTKEPKDEIAYSKPYEVTKDIRYPINAFYNEKLKATIDRIYGIDFSYLKSFGFTYPSPLLK